MSLTPEQQQALDDLVSLVPKKERPECGEVRDGETQTSQAIDWLKTWLGLSSNDVKAAVEALLTQKDHYERLLLDWVEANPLDANIEFLSLTSWAFYQAEKDANPKIKTYIDAFYYISTCLSVGYADVYAVTQTGRAIAGLVMLIGPALTNAALLRPKPS